MKIGIVTQPLAANYGGILQNYALQSVLLKMGYEPVTLRIGKKTYLKYIKKLVISIILILLGRKNTIPETPYRFKKRQSGMEKFIVKHINTTPIKSWFHIDDIIRNEIDAIIVGSDQVWRPNYNANIEDMFLCFAKNIDIPKVAYAASFGVDDWIFNYIQTNNCKELIKKFKSVSVREQSGVQLCNDYLSRNDVKWVSDPTMLIKKKEYLSLCESIPQFTEKYLFAYILDGNKDVMTYVNNKASSLGLKVVLLSAGDKAQHDETVEVWLARFRDASYVVTDSFHGTVFSLIFQKEFNTIINHSRGVARFNSLVSLFNIRNRFVYNPIESTVKCCSENIDWEDVNSKMEKFRQDSINFLYKSLENI